MQRPGLGRMLRGRVWWSVRITSTCSWPGPLKGLTAQNAVSTVTSRAMPSSASRIDHAALRP